MAIRCTLPALVEPRLIEAKVKIVGVGFRERLLERGGRSCPLLPGCTLQPRQPSVLSVQPGDELVLRLQLVPCHHLRPVDIIPQRVKVQVRHPALCTCAEHGRELRLQLFGSAM